MPTEYKSINLFGLILFCLLAPEIYADSYSDRLLDIPLEELINIKIKSATLTDESLLTIPAAVTIFTQQQIQELGINSLDELMNHVPGYQNAGVSDSNCALPSYSSRGRRITGATREVLVLLDGMRLNNERTGGLQLNNISLSNIDRVEFIRGPGSSIYGSNAFMGVINLVSSQDRREITASVGSGDWRALSASGSLSDSENLRASIFINLSEQAGDTQAYFNPATKTYTDSQSPFSNAELYLQIQSGNWSFKWHPHQVTTAEFYELGRFDKTLNDNRLAQNAFFIGYAYNLNDAWSFTANTQYTINDTYYRYNFGTPTDIKIYEVEANNQETQLAANLLWQQNSSKWLMGLELRQPDLSSTSTETIANIATTKSALTGESHRLYTAAFVQWSSDLWQGASYILGNRYDHDSFTEGRFSPRLGLIQQVSESQNFKLLYGEAFRSPTRVELNSAFSAGAPQIGNPDLTPEIAKTTELIWNYYYDEHLFSATLFHAKIVDTIAIVQTVPRSYINKDEETIRGLEVEYLWNINSTWRIRSNASVFDNSNALTPEASRLWGIDLIWNAKPWTLTFSHNYKNDVKDADNSTVGFHTLNARRLGSLYANYDSNQHWNIFFRVDNLFNKHLRAPADNPANTVGVQLPERKLSLGAGWSF
ncbi:MAG: TonB-dependent receptor [Pseudomonadota bacterium]